MSFGLFFWQVFGGACAPRTLRMRPARAVTPAKAFHLSHSRPLAFIRGSKFWLRLCRAGVVDAKHGLRREQKLNKESV